MAHGVGFLRNFLRFKKAMKIKQVCRVTKILTWRLCGFSEAGVINLQRENAIVGAHSFVNRDVGDREVVFGVPVRRAKGYPHGFSSHKKTD